MMTASELTTEVLDLQPCAADDLDVLFALWTDPASRRFLFDDREISREEAKGFLERSEDCFREEGYGLWLFFERGEKSLGGFAALLRAPLGEASLTFGTRSDLWGRGYSFQAASAVRRLRLRDSCPMTALEDASVRQDVKTFVKFLGRLVRRGLEGKPGPKVPRS